MRDMNASVNGNESEGSAEIFLSEPFAVLEELKWK